LNQPPPRQILSESQRMRAVQLSAARALPAPPPTRKAQTPRPPATRRKSGLTLPKLRPRHWIIAGVLAVFGLTAIMCMAVTAGAWMIYGSGVLPGVSVGGINLGGMSQEEATAALGSQWATIILRDGDRTWTAESASLGIALDAAATAERAYQSGRGDGHLIEALSGIEVAPVLIIEADRLSSALSALASQVEIAPQDAGVELVNGRVQARPPANGRRLDVGATVTRVTNEGAALSDGALDLVMVEVSPAITDATPMVAAASQLLSYPLTVRAFDPATGDAVEWSLPPEAWATWLTARPDNSRSTGLALSLRDEPLRDFLMVQSGVFDETRYLNMDEAISTVQNAIANNSAYSTIRVYHHDSQHVVQYGESIISIAWDYGVPYPWLQAANPGVDALEIGQTITIPSPDNFLEFPVVYDKRIVVSISQQRAWVYENGQLKWDWPVSTGINSSPTWPGIYQILSHEINAYAGNWNLWMPNFMGVYKPIPGSDFTNGFHGFPTRGGGQLLWENDLGRRVTYGCILLSNTNVQLLYDWAEEGVVVEIQG